MQDMETCVKHKVPIIITSLRPPLEIVEAAHSYGGVVFHDVINVKHARKAAEAGRRRPDPGLRRRRRPCRHAVAVRAAARGASNGSRAPSCCRARSPTAAGIASALALGADLAYIGTRFIATEEANADLAYKKALTEHAAHDIVYSQPVHRRARQLSGTVDRRPPASIRTICPVADKSKMNFGSGGNMKVKAWRDIWGSGQGIGQIADAPPVAELVARMKAEFDEASVDFLKRARA